MHHELIVMLTWHDVTVANALEIFKGAMAAPTKRWGCKLEGISEASLTELFASMKAAGKEVWLESLAVKEEDGLKAAEAAAKVGADYLMGTVYSDKILKICHDNGVSYLPFVGLDPVDTRLRGSIEEIVSDALRVEAEGVDGIGLSGFRYVSGDPVELIGALEKAIKKPFVIAGGVNKHERLDIIKGMDHLSAFTIGGAFFEEVFGKTFSEQIENVVKYLKE